MSFFKAYDMRGAYDRDFNLDTIYRIGRWLPQVLREIQPTTAAAPRLLIGRDTRLTSPAIHQTLCRGLLEAGCQLDDLGLATTPMVYLFTGLEAYDGSIQITASHNPPNHNGLKVSRQTALPVGYANGLAQLEKYVLSGQLPPPAAQPGTLRSHPRLEAFLAWLKPWHTDFSNLRLAVDCSNGMAGLFARELFGSDTLYLNQELDGNFPHHSPNPLLAESRQQLSQAVRQNQLDLGIIFDGDADRVMFVDERGNFVQPDYLIPLIADKFLAQEPGATVICDVRTSHGVTEALAAAGARVVLGKVGHAFAKVLLRETQAACGGELAGHYYFRDFCHCDSGELAALLVLEAAARAKHRGQTFSQLIAPLMKYANSGELNFLVSDKTQATAAVLAATTQLGPLQQRHEIDGVTMEYADCWFNLRQSNTEPYLRLIAEGHDPARLARVLDLAQRALRPFITPTPTP